MCLRYKQRERERDDASFQKAQRSTKLHPLNIHITYDLLIENKTELLFYTKLSILYFVRFRTE